MTVSPSARRRRTRAAAARRSATAPRRRRRRRRERAPARTTIVADRLAARVAAIVDVDARAHAPQHVEEPVRVGFRHTSASRDRRRRRQARRAPAKNAADDGSPGTSMSSGARRRARGRARPSPPPTSIATPCAAQHALGVVARARPARGRRRATPADEPGEQHRALHLRARVSLVQSSVARASPPCTVIGRPSRSPSNSTRAPIAVERLRDAAHRPPAEARVAVEACCDRVRRRRCRP